MKELERRSPCKVNLLLNILGKRTDGFHELETIMHPVPLEDRLAFACVPGGAVHLTCNHPALPVDSRNLVFRAATSFLERSGVTEGVRIHLEKHIPLAAGLGGGSSNAAQTLLALNDLFDQPLGPEVIFELAASLGSDVPFFLQREPALAIGRGEQVKPLNRFASLEGSAVLLIHPGFGVATAWAYQALAGFPDALNGRKGRAEEVIGLLRTGTLSEAGQALYNSLESPVLRKYPILGLYQEFLRENGAAGTLMSGSGSTTFALIRDASTARQVEDRFRAHFGPANWIAVTQL